MEETRAKEDASILFFVVDGMTRAISSMLEVVEYITKGREVVLVINDIEPNTNIRGDQVSGEMTHRPTRSGAMILTCFSRFLSSFCLFLSMVSAYRWAQMNCRT